MCRVLPVEKVRNKKLYDSNKHAKYYTEIKASFKSKKYICTVKKKFGFPFCSKIALLCDMQSCTVSYSM